jgi:hypothetical protein
MTDIVKKEKKVMTPERLEQLARARKKALEIRQAGAVIKMESKIANIANANSDPNFTPTPPNEVENKIIKAPLVDNPVSQELVPEYSPRVEVQPPVLVAPHSVKKIRDDFDNFDTSDDSDTTAKPPPRPPIITAEGLATTLRKKNKNGKAIKTKIVIEQSSDDEDEFHPHEHVIFVKRKSKNDSKAKVVPAATPAPPTSPVRGNRNDIPLHPQQELRQLPTFPSTTMDDFINAGFSNYRKYY